MPDIDGEMLRWPARSAADGLKRGGPPAPAVAGRQRSAYPTVVQGGRRGAGRSEVCSAEVTVPVFDYAFTVAAPLAAVRDFHRDTRALKRLTPPPVFVRLHRVEPLAEGSVSEFTLWVGPLPLRWTAVHRGVSDRGFTDVQVAGPAAAWAHTHTFVPLDAHRTEIREHIEFEHQRGAMGLVTRILFARPNLLGMFFYRSLVTRLYLRRRS